MPLTERRNLKASNEIDDAAVEKYKVTMPLSINSRIEDSLKNIADLEVFSEQLSESITVLKSELTDAASVHRRIQQSMERTKKCLLRLLMEAKALEKSELKSIDEFCNVSNHKIDEKEESCSAGDRAAANHEIDDSNTVNECATEKGVNAEQRAREITVPEKKPKKQKNSKMFFDWPEFKRIIKSTFVHRKEIEQASAQRSRMEEEKRENENVEFERDDDSDSESEYNLVTIAENTLPTMRKSNAVDEDESRSNPSSSDSNSRRTGELFGYSDFDNDSAVSSSKNFKYTSTNNGYATNFDSDPNSADWDVTPLSNGKLLVVAKVENYSEVGKSIVVEASKQNDSNHQQVPTEFLVETTHPSFSLIELHPTTTAYQNVPPSAWSSELVGFNPDECVSLQLQSPPQLKRDQAEQLQKGVNNTDLRNVLQTRWSPPDVDTMKNFAKLTKRIKGMEINNRPTGQRSESSAVNKFYSVTTSSTKTDVTASAFSSAESSEESHSVSVRSSKRQL